jgi:ornithine cyclodeaminase/alanine dehydrogenase-like protein (mu-crystallin family)
MKDQKLLYLSRADVEAVGLPMPRIIESVEAAFGEKGRGRVEAPPKPAVHPSAGAFAHAMPAWIPALRSVGIKWVSGNPDNPGRGLPYINGLVVLNDPETLSPVAVMDCTWITAKRTGAATAIVAKYLARPESSTAGILGAGVQGFGNLEALKSLFPIERVTVYDLRPEAARRDSERVRAAWPGLAVVIAREPREAVDGMDLVVTAGPTVRPPHATIKAGWLSPGAFASMVDYDSYWDRAALREADKLTTDDVAQLEDHKKLGYFLDFPPVYAELGELVAGLKRGRESPRERNIACNLGLAIDDMAVAPLVYEEARRRGIGTWLPL